MANVLKGKVAIVTGGGSGIGRATVLDMANEGAKVVVNDIGVQSNGKKSADAVVDEVKKNGGVAVADYSNIATLSGGESLVKRAINEFGKVDILVNCAGNFRVNKTVEELTEEEWDSTMNVHLKGHFSCIRAAVPYMKKQNSGRIVNISSGAAFQTGGSQLFPGGLPFSFAAYGTAKAGILGLTTNLAVELKKYGISVNAILPSAVTPLFPGERQRILGGTTGGPEFVSPLIVYLATNEAKDITGEFFYSSHGDICIFTKPFQLPGEHIFVRKMDKWTVDELIKIMPKLLVKE